MPLSCGTRVAAVDGGEHARAGAEKGRKSRFSGAFLQRGYAEREFVREVGPDSELAIRGGPFRPLQGSQSGGDAAADEVQGQALVIDTKLKLRLHAMRLAQLLKYLVVRRFR